MRRQRELLLAQQLREQDTAGAQMAAASASARASNSMLEAQKAKVMGQRDQVERLRLMQGEIDLRRQQNSNAVGRAAQLRQEADVAETGTGVTPLGGVITPQKPVFPNKPLILGMSLAGGMGLGLLAAILLEFLGRRVRSAEDVFSALQVPVLAVVRNDVNRKRPWWSLGRLVPRNVGLRTRTARA